MCGRSLIDHEDWEPTLTSLIDPNTICGVQEAQRLKIESCRKSGENEDAALANFSIVSSRAGHSAVLTLHTLSHAIRWRSDADCS